MKIDDMKPIKTQNIFTLMLIFGLVFSSCETLDEEPKGSVDIDAYFNTTDDALNVLTGAYAQLRRETHYSKNYIISLEVGSDDCDPGGQNEAPTRVMQDLYNYNGYDPALETVWYWGWNVINRASMVVAKTPLVSGSEDLKERIIGEARFLRCLIYFNFLRMYGDIPFFGNSYVEDPASTNSMTRTAVDEIYNFMEEDLLLAIDELWIQSRTEKGRASRGAAQALLAKVYLTRAGWRFDAKSETMVKGDNSNYQKARDMAKTIIDEGQYRLNESYDDMFAVEKENSNPEAIFFINAHSGYAEELGLLQAGQQFLFRVRPKSNGWSSCVPELELYYAFDSINDRRVNASFLTHVFAKIDGTSVKTPDGDPPFSEEVGTKLDWKWERWLAPRPHINKYLPPEEYIEIGNGSKETSNNLPVFRYSEVLLMFAEADNEVNNGPTLESENTLNEVRNRAGLGSWRDGDIIYGENVSYSSDHDGFFEALKHQRRLELCFEIKRRFDLMRWGELVDRIKAIPTIKENAGLEVTEYDLTRAQNIKEYHNLLALPQVELDNNKNLTQNPGF